MFYKECKNTNDFTKFKTIYAFRDSINNIITIKMGNHEQEQSAKKQNLSARLDPQILTRKKKKKIK